MSAEIKYISFVPSIEKNAVKNVSGDSVKNVMDFHSGIEAYGVTPLVSLSTLAEKAGVEYFAVKNESLRFGLNAFKGLGGSYAIAKYLCRRFNIPLGKDTFALMRSPEYSEQIKKIVFATATDGNHGRGVAWFSSLIGCDAHVFLPAGTAAERLENIKKLGAYAEITEWNYDDTVRYVDRLSRENGWVLVQDTSWDGYEDIPLNVMQGYTTIGKEITAQLKEQNMKKPTHIFLQAGVGSMAAAIAGFLSAEWGDECPIITVVEPDKADCLFRTAAENDGRLHCVGGMMESMMAGLCCGEPCPLAWDILRETASGFISCTDDFSALGMRLLAHPENGDSVIESGESGAVTAGIAFALLTDSLYEKEKKMIGLDADSRILVISTEGATDRENYSKIVNG